MDIIYRKATAKDIDSLVHLRKKQLIDEGDSPITNIDNDLKEYFNDNLKSSSVIIWLATIESEIIATGGICFYQLPPTYKNPTGQIAYITNMYTKNDYRRQGIAAFLLQKLIDEAKKRDYNIIKLHSSLEAKSIYIKNGFIDSSGYMDLYL